MSTAFTFGIAAVVALCGLASSCEKAAAAALPDGRAYEQVTPVEKNGNNIQGKVNLIEAASHGSAITSVVQGGIPGGEGAQEYPYYLSTRGPAAWSTQGLLPVASSGFLAEVLGWDEELTGSFDYTLEELAKPPVTYYRSASGGGLIPVATGMEEPHYVGSTPDGGVAVFESNSAILPGAAEFASNVYVWNRAGGELRLGSVLNDGEAASSQGSFGGPYDWFYDETSSGGARGRYYTQAQHALSEDGSALWFTASSTAPQVYLRRNPIAVQSALNGQEECTESAAACTYEVSASERAVPEAEMPAAFVGATPDGSTALFLSSAKLTEDATTGPTDEGKDLYRYEADAPAGERLTDLTVDSEATDPNGAEVRGVVGMSEDASYVYFVANGVLGDGAASGATPGDCGPGSSGVFGGTGSCSLYVWHEGRVHYVAPLTVPAFERETTSDGTDWVPTSHSPSGQAVGTARVSADGRVLLFRSVNKLSIYDNEGVPELYRYEVGAPGIQCVTCSPSGTPPEGRPTLQSINSAEQGVAPPVALLTRNLSSNGNRIFFETPAALLSSDTNGATDVYEWEADGEGSCAEISQGGGCLYLISTGASPQPSYFADATAEGEDVFFFTSQPLVGQDRDELVDIYDAKLGGGLASQNPPPPSSCEGEACRGAAVTAPTTEPAGTATFVGPVNPAPRHVCRKGHVKRHGRCVKRKSHKRHRRKHSATKAHHKRHPKADRHSLPGENQKRSEG